MPEVNTSYATLADAVTAIGSTQVTLAISATTSVSSSLTIPANITLLLTDAGMISVSSGQTLTINGPIEAPVRQIFAGSGTVSLGKLIKEAYPEWFGAAGDGTTDDTTAIDKAQLALSPGATLFFHEKTYNADSGLTPKRADIKWKGAGPFLSTIKRTSGHLFLDSSTFPISNVVFEDLGFDMGNSGFFVFNLLGHVRGLTVRRCRWWRIGSASGAGYGLLATSTPNITIEDCLFHNPGNAAGVAIQVEGGSSNLHVRRNRFLYCGSAMSAQGTAGQPVEGVVFEDNYVDGAWMYGATAASGSGVNVTYSGNKLTHMGVTFGTLTANDTVRVLPVRATGSGGTVSYTRTKLTDTNSTPFSAVKRGDIVRSGAAFAIVTEKESSNVIWVEEWLSDSDRLPVAAPGAGDTYTVYRLILGDIVSNTSTEITVNRWYDIDGDSVTPAAQTRYELLLGKPSHAVNIGIAARNVKIHDNTILRSGADQIIATGSKQSIRGNTIGFGWDVGITFWGSQSTVNGNVIEHQASTGIWTNGTGNVIANNTVIDSRWILSAPNAFIGDITIQGGSHNRITGNHCDVATTLNAEYGIVILADSGGATDNVIAGNTSRNHTTDDIGIYINETSATCSGNMIVGNKAGVISQWAASGATITGTRVSGNRATTFNLSKAFYTGTYANTRFRDNEFGAIVTAGGTTVTGTDWDEVKVVNRDDGAGNSEYFEIFYSSDLLYLQSTKTGTGSARAIKIDSPDFAVKIGGVDAWGVFSDKMLYPGADNSYDLGSGSFRVRDGYFGTSVKTPKVNLTTTVTPSGTGDTQGNTGDVRYDDNFLYIKTSIGWRRVALTSF